MARGARMHARAHTHTHWRRVNTHTATALRSCGIGRHAATLHGALGLTAPAARGLGAWRVAGIDHEHPQRLQPDSPRLA